jgi:peptidoglycan hydrolase CwlO-like protein
MKKLFFYILITFLFGILLLSNPVFSADACPSNYTYSQCINYLSEQSQKLKNESNKLSSKISNEDYNQLTLQQKINYIEDQVKASENQIKSLELNIETKNVEIRILSNDIEILQNDIGTASQEVVTLKSIINKRMSLTYKYTFISPLEIFLESSNFDSLLRRFKYLAETRGKDNQLLETLSVKVSHLKVEETALANKKREVESKLSEIEKSKLDIFTEKVTLEKQKTQKSILYAESQKKEAEYISQLNKNRKAQARLDSAIIAYIIKNSGNSVYGGTVSRGQAIGTMGNTGLSYGAHLHFSISSKKQIGSGNIDPTKGYLKVGPDYYAKTGSWYYYYVRSGTYQLPLAGSVIITQDAHQGLAIDMVSLQGEGALVLAADSGKIYSGKDQYGGKYVFIDHPSGKRTTYLHLKSVYVTKL